MYHVVQGVPRPSALLAVAAFSHLDGFNHAHHEPTAVQLFVRTQAPGSSTEDNNLNPHGFGLSSSQQFLSALLTSSTSVIRLCHSNWKS